MRCLILAAGLGNRLYPITKKTPKCLVKVNGIPVIDYVLSSLHDVGISEIVVNLHYKHEKVIEHLGDRVIYSYEPDLLGSAATIAKLSPWLASGDKKGDFLVVNADTISNLRLENFIEFHKSQNSSVTESRDKNNLNTGAYLINNNFVEHLVDKKDLDEVINEFHINARELNVSFPSVFYQGDIVYLDIGTKEKLKYAEKYLNENKETFKMPDLLPKGN